MSTNDRQTQVGLLVSLQSEANAEDPKLDQNTLLVSLQSEANLLDPQATQIAMLVSYLPTEIETGTDVLFFGCNS